MPAWPPNNAAVTCAENTSRNCRNDWSEKTRALVLSPSQHRGYLTFEIVEHYIREKKILPFNALNKVVVVLSKKYRLITMFLGEIQDKLGDLNRKLRTRRFYGIRSTERHY